MEQASDNIFRMVSCASTRLVIAVSHGVQVERVLDHVDFTQSHPAAFPFQRDNDSVTHHPTSASPINSFIYETINKSIRFS